MTYDEILEHVLALSQQDKRVVYQVLKRRFSLDGEYVEDLKADLIDAKRLAVDEDEKVLCWRGDEGGKETATTPQTPASCMPPHLVERIRAEQAAMESRGSADGERKTITALFTDLIRIDGLNRRTRSGRRSGEYRSRVATDDGRRASVRRLCRPSVRRWHLCAVWGARCA